MNIKSRSSLPSIQNTQRKSVKKILPQENRPITQTENQTAVDSISSLRIPKK